MRSQEKTPRHTLFDGIDGSVDEASSRPFVADDVDVDRRWPSEDAAVTSEAEPHRNE
jgi:hypothetical protein